MRLYVSFVTQTSCLVPSARRSGMMLDFVGLVVICEQEALQ